MNETEATIAANSRASDGAQQERSRIVDLMQRLEAALANASFQRVDDWNEHVQHSLAELQSALMESRVETNSKKGLFAEITEDHPRLLPRIEKLKKEYDDLERQIVTLRDQFQSSDHSVDVSDVRGRLNWLVKALRHVQSKETELIFEAIGRDIGGGD